MQLNFIFAAVFASLTYSIRTLHTPKPPLKIFYESENLAVSQRFGQRVKNSGRRTSFGERS